MGDAQDGTQCDTVCSPPYQPALAPGGIVAVAVPPRLGKLVRRVMIQLKSPQSLAHFTKLTKVQECKGATVIAQPQPGETKETFSIALLQLGSRTARRECAEALRHSLQAHDIKAVNERAARAVRIAVRPDGTGGVEVTSPWDHPDDASYRRLRRANHAAA